MTDERVSIHITLDPDKGLFRATGLILEEESYLELHKYRRASFVPIGKTRQEEYYVKPAPPESLSHTFLVLNIRDHLLRHTKHVTVAKTREPDIIFTNKCGERIALEVETGKGFKKHQERVKEKFRLRKREYQNRLYIILTDTNQKRRYRHYFPRIKEFLTTLKLALHPTKCKITPLRRGTTFLGFRIYEHHKLVRARNLRKIRSKLHMLLDGYEYNAIDATSVLNVLQGWNGYAMHANTHKLRQQLIDAAEQELVRRTPARKYWREQLFS